MLSLLPLKPMWPLRATIGYRKESPWLNVHLNASSSRTLPYESLNDVSFPHRNCERRDRFPDSTARWTTCSNKDDTAHLFCWNQTSWFDDPCVPINLKSSILKSNRNLSLWKYDLDVNARRKRESGPRKSLIMRSWRSSMSSPKGKGESASITR